jgi:hypothetical protein
MTALGQGMAGLALVMGFALLSIRQISAAAILLCVQSAAVAVAAIVARQPLMALPPPNWASRPRLPWRSFVNRNPASACLWP